MMQTRSKRKLDSPTGLEETILPLASTTPATALKGGRRNSGSETIKAACSVTTKKPKEKDIDEDNTAEILKIEEKYSKSRKGKGKGNGKAKAVAEDSIHQALLGGEFNITNMTIDDLKAVYNLGEKIFTTDYPELHRTWDEFEVVNNFNSETEYCLITKISDKIVGFALGTIIEKSISGFKYGYLAWIGVHPKYQRKGVGTKLFAHFKDLMIGKEVQMMLADTNSSNQPAVNFLDKMGFGHRRDHVYLSLNLARDRKLRDADKVEKRAKSISSKKNLAPRIFPPTLPMPDTEKQHRDKKHAKEEKAGKKAKTEAPEKGKVSVREMEIDDLADVFHLGERIFTSKFVNLYRIWSEWEVTDLYNSDPEYCSVAEVDDAIAGFSMGYIIKKSHSSWTYGYLVWLGVSPDFQRMGIGSKLLDHFRKMMEAENIRMLIVDTQADNEPAIKLFERAGFGHPQQHMYMSLDLNNAASNNSA